MRDTISIELLLIGNVIENIRFSGVGCAISQASASLLTEHVKGKALVAVKNLTPDDVFALLAVTLTPSRVRCALLGYEALMKTIAKVI